MTELEHGERPIETCEHLFFSENFEQMIETWAGVAPGYGETGRMHNRTRLHTKLFRGRFHGSFNFVCRKIFDSDKRFADRLQSSRVLGRKIFGDAFRAVNDVVREIETAVSH